MIKAQKGSPTLNKHPLSIILSLAGILVSNLTFTEDNGQVGDLSIQTNLTKNTSLNLTALNLFTKTAKREDKFFTADNALDAYSTTEEPTYRSIYLKLNHSF